MSEKRAITCFFESKWRVTELICFQRFLLFQVLHRRLWNLQLHFPQVTTWQMQQLYFILPLEKKNLQNSWIILINESLKEKTAIVPRDLSVNKFDVIWVAAKLALICTSRAPWIFWYNFIVTVLRIKSCGILHVDNFSAPSQECTFFV